MHGEPAAMATVPLANRVAFRSSDPAEVHSQITRYFKPHDLRFLDGRNHRLDTVLRRTKVGQLAVNVLEYGGNVMVDPGPLDSFYLLHINLTGQCELTHERGHMTINRQRAAVCAPHRPHRFWWQPDSRVIAIQIPTARLHAHVGALTGRPPRQPVDFALEMDLDRPEMAAFSDLVAYVLQDGGRDDGLGSDAVTAAALEAALLTALLRLQPGSHRDALAQQGGGAAPGYVRRAERFMQDNLDRAVSVAEMAAAAGVTERTLTSGFQRFRGDSPARHFLGLRLAQARAQLLAAEPGRSVCDIAFDLGFQHLSGFAAAYRRRYDEAPSQTLRRADNR